MNAGKKKSTIAISEEIVLRKPADLLAFPNNSRTHSDEQVQQIVASIEEFGFTNPILIREDTIGAGHGRILAAIILGMPLVPTIDLSHLSDEQFKAYVIVDNQLTLNAGWDLDLLSAEIESLISLDFDIDLLGFDVDFLANILGPSEGNTNPDSIPALTTEPISKVGDIWQLGTHRLMCGDSTSSDAVNALMNGNMSDLLFTSPPYAQQRDYGAAKESVQEWDILMDGVFAAPPVKPGASILVNLGLVHNKGRLNSYWDHWLEFMNASNWPLFGWYVWDQGSGMPGVNHGRLASSHEFIFHFVQKPEQSRKWVDKKPENISAKSKSTFRKKDGSMKKIGAPEKGLQTTKIADSVIRVNRNPAQAAGTGHPATFPTQLCIHLYNSFAKRGDIIYEPFNGAGTSIIACEQYGASCYAMELDPLYVDVAVKRWEQFTGQKVSKIN